VKTSDYLSSGEIILDFVTDNKYYFTGNIAPARKAPLQVFYLLARETGQLFLTASGPIGLAVDKMLWLVERRTLSKTEPELTLRRRYNDLLAIR